jgi:hypothetical protein
MELDILDEFILDQDSLSGSGQPVLKANPLYVQRVSELEAIFEQI